MQLKPDEMARRRMAYLARFAADTRSAPLDTERVREVLAAQSVAPLSTRAIDWPAFEAFCAEADYASRYPEYCREFGVGPVFLGKCLEHYLSLVALDPRPGQIHMDVAASHSPCADLFRRLRQVERVYRQDLNYKPGLNGETIGSPASAIPMDDGAIDGITLHNSWEHFEGDEDLAFLFEARRLLKPGGRLVIVPLFLKARMEIWTSPAVWGSKFVSTSATPAFDPRGTIVVREDVKQRQAKFFDPVNLVADLARVPDMTWTILHLANAAERPYGFPFVLVANRTA